MWKKTRDDTRDDARDDTRVIALFTRDGRALMAVTVWAETHITMTVTY